MTQKFIIPGRLAGYNDLHKPWMVSHRIKTAEMVRVFVALKRAHIKPVQTAPVITISCYEPDLRRDEDNVQSGAKKIILDALQQSGIIKNDNRKGLNKSACEVLLDRKNPRVEVGIAEAVEIVRRETK